MRSPAPTNVRPFPKRQDRTAIAGGCVAICVLVGAGCLLLSKPKQAPTPQTAMPPGCENPSNAAVCGQLFALVEAYDATLSRFDMSASPQPENMGIVQKAVLSEAYRARTALEEQMKTPGHVCNQHPTRHRLTCSRGAIATNVLPEMALAEEGHSFGIARINEDGTVVALDRDGNPVPGRRFVLVQVDDSGNTVSDPAILPSLRSASKNEMVVLGMVRGTALSIAATDIPLAEHELSDSIAKAQVAWEKLGDATQSVAAEVIQPIDTAATVERAGTYWQRELEGTTQQGEVVR